ncbi:4-(cytidine 5'-diphospho)-2-C-methyl-D-erythritol kinase [Actinomycetaceae bacterium TAE3-ERU4]|nr:4-(cytidine 5'-diphospho)-2-C-methyl-D-erythritol kinase [Actinomycetaceae bacterium TAE3-ERU4]
MRQQHPRKSVTASAPAKVNLILKCGLPEEETGYHHLFTVFHSLNLRETVRFIPRADRGFTISDRYLGESGQELPIPSTLKEMPPEKHLALRAAQILFDKFDLPGGGQIEVSKRVPVAGGMAGGSADAAASLVAVNTAYDLGLSPKELAVIGRELGADVPACLLGEVTVGTGRGDRLHTLSKMPSRIWVMGINQKGLATPQVFKQADKNPENLSIRLPQDLTEKEKQVLAGENWEEFLALLVNDLQAPALVLRPDLISPLQAVNALYTQNGQRLTQAIISGSGPTIAAPARNLDQAKVIAQTLLSCEGIERTLILDGPSEPAKIEEVEE